MKKFNKQYLIGLAREHWILLAMCLVFTTLAITLSSTWFRYAIAPDTSSYFAIAQKYAEGDIRHAINGYWGPLLSWLLAPSFWLNIDTVIAARLILTVVALGIMVTLYRFLLEKTNKTIAILLVAISGCSLVDLAASQAITPDLLLTWFTLLLAIGWAKFLEAPTKKQGVYIGILGALMYFSKGFGFFLFLGILVIIAAIKVYQKRKAWKQIARQFAPVTITFFLLTIPFISLISIKYHKPMINAAGEYNNHTMGPVAKGQQPMTYMGPLAPPNDTAVSVWEDPSKTTNLIPDWSPLESREYFNYYMSSILGMNLNRTLLFVTNFGAATVAGLFIAYLSIVKKGKDRIYYALFSGTFTLVALGYAAILTEGRYLWCAIFFGVLSLGLWTSMLLKRSIVNTTQVILGGLVIFALAALSLGQQLVNDHRHLSPEWKTAYMRAESIKKVVPKGAPVISDSFSDYYTCYQLQLHCYGVLQTPADKDMKKYAKHVKAFGVKYLIDTHRREGDKQFAKYIDQYFVKIAQTNVEGGTITTVYKLKN